MNQDFECPRCGHCCQLLETEQEPVAWMHTTGTGHVYFRKKPQDKVFSPQPVYTVPPKREWVGLTSDDIHDAFCHAEYDANQDWNDDPEGWCKAFASYVEAKLKDKNGG